MTTNPLQVHFFVEICIFHFQIIWKWIEKESETKLYHGVTQNIKHVLFISLLRLY